MALFFQIVLALGSGVIFFVLMRKAFFAGQFTKNDLQFESLDVAVALSLSVLFAYLAFNLFTSPASSFTEKDIVGSLITQALLGGAVLIYLRFRGILISQFFAASEYAWWKYVGLGLLLMLGLFPFIGVLANWINSEPSQEQEAVQFFQKTTSVQSRLLLAFMAVVVAPVVEEIVFRGLLYRILRGYFGKIAAMFFTSVLFASIHGNVPTLLPLTLLAMALVAALEVSGSLLVSIVMHATFNGVSLLLILYTSTP